MAKIFKIWDVPPSNLTAYQRSAFEAALDTQSNLAVMEPEPVIDPALVREAILAEARAEAEAKIREAYAQGYARGYEAGEVAFKATIAEAATAVESATAALREEQAEFLTSLEPQILSLVKTLAERVIAREWKADETAILTTVRRALNQMADREQLTIRLNPSDLEAMRHHKITLLEEIEGIQRIDLEPDAEIAPGGCIIDSKTLQVDARIETLVNRIFDGMTE